MDSKLIFPVIIRTTEMHTNGGPFRIVETGYPPIKGETILEKIKFLRLNLDPYRKLLMSEPRGHSDMFGTILVEPDHKEADVGVIFIHNEGYSIMCGHGIISLGRYCVDKGLVKTLTTPETKVNVQCPCGLVEVYVQYDGVKSGAVRFKSVPSFVFALDFKVDVPGYGTITVDIAFGGAFYAVVDAKQYGLDVTKSRVTDIQKAAGDTTDALKKQIKLTHPESSDLAFVYGTIMTDGKDMYSEEATSNICIFADRQIDRSPCGSGVTTRAAIMYARGFLNLGQSRQFKCLTGTTFTSKPIRKVQYGPYDNAVIVEVSGHGYYTGTSVYTLEEDDIIGQGFLLN